MFATGPHIVNSICVKKGAPIIGVRSESLHKRVKDYVDALNDENVTMSSVVRQAVKEKIERLEAEMPVKPPLLKMVADAEQKAASPRRRKAKRPPSKT